MHCFLFVSFLFIYRKGKTFEAFNLKAITLFSVCLCCYKGPTSGWRLGYSLTQTSRFKISSYSSALIHLTHPHQARGSLNVTTRIFKVTVASFLVFMLPIIFSRMNCLETIQPMRVSHLPMQPVLLPSLVLASLEAQVKKQPAQTRENRKGWRN